MTAFTRIAATETRIYLRSPGAALLGTLFPALLLVGIGLVPATRKVSENYGGLPFLNVWAPSLIVMAITVLGLQVLPSYLASYRERGVLRRLATTPVNPANLLAVQLLINVVVAAVGTALLLVVAALAFDIPGPRDPLGFTAAFLLGTASIYGFGLLSAALSRTARAAGGIAMILFVPAMFFGGVWVPRQFLPDVLQEIGKYLPPGVQALQDGWTGAGVQPLQLVALGAFAIGCGVVATKVFRWE